MIQRKVTFMEAVVSAMTCNYCKFSGRASRSELWWFTLFVYIVWIAVTLVFISNESGRLIATSVVSLALMLPMLGVQVRRLHDIGKSGWWLLIALIPLVGGILLLVWYCKPSEPSINVYGQVPNA